MKKNEQNTFFRLYSGRRRLTVHEKESIIDSVIEQTVRTKKKRGRFGLERLLTLRTAGVAALTLVLAVPLVLFYMQDQNAEEYMARGADPKPTFSVNCLESDSSTCRRGDKLFFTLRSTNPKRFFSAFSKHSESGAVVWYFPSAEREKAISVSNTIDGGLVDEGIVIGQDHPLGGHEIFGVFSHHPATRDEIRKLFDEDSNRTTDEYVIQKLKVDIGMR